MGSSCYLLLIRVGGIVVITACLPEDNHIVTQLKSHAQPPWFDSGVVNALDEKNELVALTLAGLVKRFL